MRNPRSAVALRLGRENPADVVVCSIVRAELAWGALHSAAPQRAFSVTVNFLSAFASLPFDDSAADIYGWIRADLAANGTLIGPNDLLIAAIALSNKVTLVTHNTREFSRVVGLMLDDWEDGAATQIVP